MNDEETFTPPPITGYRELSQQEVEAVNHMKKLEGDLFATIKDIGSLIELDPRWKAISKTHLQQGFMAINRAILKPRE